MRSDYASEFDAFSEALTRAWYRHAAGIDAGVELEAVFDRYGDLFRQDEIAGLAERAASAFTERERKALRYLRAAAIEEHLSAGTRELDEELAERESAATVDWDGGTLPLHAVKARLVNEPRCEVRHALAARREGVTESLNDLRAERLERRRDMAKSLGAESTAALWSDATGIDYSGLAANGGALLAETEDRYAAALADLLRERADVALARAWREDLMRAVRATDFDDAFPGARMSVAYRDVFAGLGIRTGAQENIELDFADRPSKRARPFCAPVRVPGEIKLVLRPVGGVSDYASLLHEGGHAQHFGFTSAGLDVAFTRAGDRGTSELWAFLFQYLLLDAGFLAERFALRDAAELRRVLAIERCAMVRRHAGKLAYEEALHSDRIGLAAARAHYVETLAGAACVRHAPSDYLADMDDGFYVADYLRAWAAEVLVREHMRTMFGRRWWASAAAGNLLKELWATGFEYTVDEVAAELGLGAVTLGPLADDVREGLGR